MMGIQHDWRRGMGFTITEVIVTLAIMGLVTAIVVPGLQWARKRARTVQGLSNLHQIGQGIYSYATSQSNRLPFGYRKAGLGPLETDWAITISDHLGGGGDTYMKLATGPRQNKLLPMFLDPNATFPGGLYHYSAHPILMPNKEWEDSGYRLPLYRLSWVRRPTELILVMDGIQRPDSPVPHTPFATAANIDNDSINPEAMNPTINGWDDALYFDIDDNDNDTAIAIGYNHDPPPGAVPPGTKLADIRWRQAGNNAANFLFVNGHAQTLRHGAVKRRHIRVDDPDLD